MSSARPRGSVIVSLMIMAVVAWTHAASMETALAAEGDLDQTFDGDGIRPVDGYRRAVAVRNSGKIVAVGVADGDGGVPGSFDGEFVVERYLADGSPDPTFDGDGRAATDLCEGCASEDHIDESALDLAFQNDGKIVVVGHGDLPSRGIGAPAILRYNADGSLDSAFGESGIVRGRPLPLGTASAIALQANGRILIAGGQGLMRLRTDGSPDTSFDEDGVLQLPKAVNVVADVALQDDGRIVVVGKGHTETDSSTNFAVLRYRTGGQPDRSFGHGGRIFTDFASSRYPNPVDRAEAIDFRPNGSIVVAGSTTDHPLRGQTRFALARYLRDGSLDTTFNGDGRVRTSFGPRRVDQAFGVAVQDDGRIVAAGWNTKDTDLDVARYTADGDLDERFGDSGRVTLAGESAVDVAIQTDGKLVTAGGILARFEN